MEKNILLLTLVLCFQVKLSAEVILKPLEVKCSIPSERQNTFEPIFLEVEVRNLNEQDIVFQFYDLVSIRVSLRETKDSEWRRLITVFPSRSLMENYRGIRINGNSDTTLHLLTQTWYFPPGTEYIDTRILSSGESYELKVEIFNNRKRQVKKYCEIFQLNVKEEPFDCQSIIEELKYPHFIYYWSPLVSIRDEQEREKMLTALEELTRQNVNTDIKVAATIYSLLNRSSLAKSPEEKEKLCKDFIQVKEKVQLPYWVSFLQSLERRLQVTCFPYF